jgi:hypothetical protein
MDCKILDHVHIGVMDSNHAQDVNSDCSAILWYTVIIKASQQVYHQPKISYRLSYSQRQLWIGTSLIV